MAWPPAVPTAPAVPLADNENEPGAGEVPTDRGLLTLRSCARTCESCLS